jgi:peptide/nickel transport system substrate-binding protein
MLRSSKFAVKRKPAGMVGLLVAMTIAILSLSAAGNAASGKSLVIDVSCTPNSLDPAAARSGECGVLTWEFYPTLVAWAAKPGPGPGTLAWDRSKVVPGVAQSWTISTNGRVYTFHLNPKAKFPDGTKITCQDVLFNFTRDTATGLTAFSFWGTGQTDNYPAITCPNPATVVLTLPVRPNPDVLLGLVQASMLVEPSVLNTHPDTTVNGVLTPDPYWASHIAGGGGPFLLTSYTPGSQMVATVNPDYVGPHVALSGITINFITDHTTLILNAQSGQADITTGLTVPEAASLQGKNGLRTFLFPSSNWIDLGFVWNKPPFNNLKFREAMTHAIPFAQIQKTIGGGRGQLFYGPIPPGFSFYNADLEGPKSPTYPTYDIDLAKKLIAQSGVTTPVNVTMDVVAGDSVGTAIGTTLQSIWQPLGVNLNVSVIPSAQFNTTVIAGQDNMFTFTDGAAVGTPAALLAFDMQCNAQFNRTKMCIPAADLSYFKARTVIDPAKAKKYWDKVIRLWQAAYPKVNMYTATIPVVLSQKVKTFFFFSSLFYYYYDA